MVEHLSAGNLRLHSDVDRFVYGSELFEEVRQAAQQRNQRAFTGDDEFCSRYHSSSNTRPAEKDEEASSGNRYVRKRNVRRFV